MKKKTIVLLLLIVVGVLIYCVSFNSHIFSGINSPYSDTILVKQFCESAKTLQQNNPDSAIIEYQKAIQLLENIPKNDRINYLLAATYLDLSYLYIIKGDFDQQKEYAQKGLSIAGQGDKELNALGLYYEGLTYYRRGELDTALSLYIKAEELAKQADAKKLVAKLFSNIAIIHYRQGNNEKAIEDFSKVQAIGVELQDEELINGSYINLGLIYTHKRDFEKAKEVYAKAITYYSESNDDEGLILCFMNLGNVYYTTEDYSEALSLYQQSSALAIKIGAKQEISKTYNNMGEIYRIIGDQDRALEMYYHSLNVKDEILDKSGKADTFRALADLYYRQNVFSKSLEYYEKALEIDSSLNLVSKMAMGYANISAVYKEYKQYEKAVEYGLKSTDLYKQIGDVWGESETYQILGSIYLSQEKHDSALKYYQKSLEQKKSLSFDFTGLASAYLLLSEFYLNKPQANSNDIKRAEQYGLAGYHIVDSIKRPVLVAQASDRLAQVYEKQQNYRQAARFLKINKQANDTLFNQSKAEALVFAEARWSDEKNQEQIRHLEQENQSIIMQKEEEHKRHQLVLYGLTIIFGLVVFTVVLFWKYKHKQREMRLQQQLANITVLRLQNIQNRISPHFMFNVLNAVIPALREHEELSRPLHLLIQSIRGNLRASDKIAIPLDEEIAIVKNYIELRESIHSEFIHIVWNIETEVDMNVLLPSMMIQIPVENAIKYAFEPDSDNKIVKINITQNNQSVNILIQDNGIGFNPGKGSDDPRSTGNGLKILFKTVELLNTKNHHPLKIDIQNLSESSGLVGTKVEITIPLDYKYTV